MGRHPAETMTRYGHHNVIIYTLLRMMDDKSNVISKGIFNAPNTDLVRSTVFAPGCREVGFMYLIYILYVSITKMARNAWIILLTNSSVAVLPDVGYPWVNRELADIMYGTNFSTMPLYWVYINPAKE